MDIYVCFCRIPAYQKSVNTQRARLVDYQQNTYLWRNSNYFNKLSRERDIVLFCPTTASALRVLSRGFFEKKMY